MFSQTNTLFRFAFVTVVALIATAVVSLTVVLSHEDTAMAADTPWPSKPPASSGAPAPAAAAASSTPTTVPISAPTTAQTSPVAENSPVASVKPTKAATKPATRAPLTYTVKKGDNLTVIADWFKLHGYGDLYERNRKTIGADPDLIRPGQKITVSSAGMSTK